jgi:predicted membrane-bound spermidine synthase
MKTCRANTVVPDQSLARGLRRYLYCTAAFAGAAIMIIEILGAKMLAPYFGTSHFVWTAQIAVTLMALAAGYYAGGRLVDHNPKLDRVYLAVLLAAVYLCATVPLVGTISFWCLDLNLALGSLVAAALLFFVPLALLAMVGPFFVRALTSSVSTVGGSVGLLTAVSTLGSFVGTLLIGYVLIPFFPNSITMFITAGSLMLVVVGYFLGWGRKGAPALVILLALGIGVLVALLGVVKDLQARVPGGGAMAVFRSNSNFGELLVVDYPSSPLRLYLNDLLEQNGYDKRRGQATDPFCYMLGGLARTYTPALKDVLCIGLGVGIVPRELCREGVHMDVVEINPAVPQIAKVFFGCPTEKLNVILGDGRQFVNKCGKKYDAILLDAFLGESSPSHLMSVEAFRAMRNVLNAKGVLVINSFGHLEPGRDFLGASLDKTLKQVFRSVRIHAAPGGNTFYVASEEPKLVMYRQLDMEQVHPVCRKQVAEAFAHTPLPDPRSGIVLTDDYNPVEYYDAANREIVRRRLALAMRSP